MKESFEIAKRLADALSERRLTNTENELAEVFRSLEPNEKLRVIEILMAKNVRAAVSIAARGHLPKAEQEQLIERAIVANQTNALKAFISDFIVHRMSPDVFISILNRLKATYPERVNFAAYYFIGSTKDPAVRSSLRSIFLETKPQ
jgi:hypothetical protein